MRIIVFGNGTIGAAVQILLRDTGHEVLGVGRSAGDVRADLTDIAGLRALFAAIGPFDAVACAAGDVFPAPARNGERRTMGQVHRGQGHGPRSTSSARRSRISPIAARSRSSRAC